MLAIRTVLHPTDFSTNSETAFRIACSLARDYGARFILLHVDVPPIVLVNEGLGIPQPAGPGDDTRLKDKLEQLKAPDPKVRVEHVLVKGDPTSEILRVAQENKADVIVMGTHGRTGLGRLLMGSVAEQVVRKAPCPVVTVKLPLSQASSATGSHSGEASTTPDIIKFN
jgi:nucleotide-binding universal stress UspA family protein